MDEPTVIAIDDQLLLMPPTAPKKWRCSRGHTWESPVRIVGMLIEVTDLIEREEFCFLCLRDLLREKCGHIHEVK